MALAAPSARLGFTIERALRRRPSDSDPPGDHDAAGHLELVPSPWGPVNAVMLAVLEAVER